MSPKRLGKPLPPATAAESKVTPTDVALAQDAWTRDAKSPYKRLLDAKPETDA